MGLHNKVSVSWAVQIQYHDFLFLIPYGTNTQEIYDEANVKFRYRSTYFFLLTHTEHGVPVGAARQDADHDVPRSRSALPVTVRHRHPGLDENPGTSA